MKFNFKTAALSVVTVSLFGFSSIGDDPTGTLSGTVASNGQPLVGAKIRVMNDPLSTISDSQGRYTIQPIVGFCTLICEATGYLNDTVKNLPIHAAQQVLAFELRPSPMPMVSDTARLQQPLVMEDAVDVMTIVSKSMKHSESMRMHFSSNAAGAKALTNAMDRSMPIRQVQTEQYHQSEESGFLNPLKAPLSTFSIDVDKAAYANCRRMLNGGQLPPTAAVRIEEFVNYFPYNYPKPIADQPFSVSTNLLPCPWKPAHRVAHIGIKGKELDLSEAPATNLVFLLDVSGSMGSSNKLPLVKQSMKMLADQLREQDKVSIVVYAGAAGIVLDGSSDPAEIEAALNQLNAGGSTAGGAGIELAYATARKHFIQGGNNRVILCTDGDFNVGVRSHDALVKLIEQKRASGMFLTVMGFGSGNLKDHTMEQLADKGNGSYYYIDNLLEARKNLVEEMGGTLFTIAKDVKIQVEFNPAQVQAYRLIGYENRLLDAQDFNDDKKDAGEIGAGHTVTALYEIVPVGVEMIGTVDALKYQQVEQEKRPVAQFDDEWMTVKLRYKDPEATASQLIVQPVKEVLVKQSKDAEFAMAVAEFGMLLSESNFCESCSVDGLLDRARAARGIDEKGYRAEFIRLVELYKAMI